MPRLSGRRRGRIAPDDSVHRACDTPRLAIAADAAEGTVMQRGGGIILAVSLLLGAGIGVHYGEGSLGIVVGLAVGLVAVVLLAWQDSRRRR